ncbi:MAG: GGDEF domain-containing protein [Clostridia bacterium]|nr:GGDEF domain-containing protein [Clostridia bacterium]
MRNRRRTRQDLLAPIYLLVAAFAVLFLVWIFSDKTQLISGVIIVLTMLVSLFCVGYSAMRQYKNVIEDTAESLLMATRAQTDSLTQILNRGAAQSYISRVLKNIDSMTKTAFFLVDLDNFKQVNDMLGHAEGDETLKSAARELRRLFRSTDLVGRLGGDEFVVFLKNFSDEQFVTKKAEAICRALKGTFKSGAQSVTVTCSVGVTIVYNTSVTFDELYRISDASLYKVKNEGKSGYVLTHVQEDNIKSEDYVVVDDI